MKAGHILSAGLLSIWIFGCDQGTGPEQRREPIHNVVSAVNAASKVGAAQAGYGITREVADTNFSFDMFKSQELQQQMRDIGICENFIQLIADLANLTAGDQSALSSRWMKAAQCLETEAQNMSFEDASGEAIFPVLDKCFCDGSGTVFAAIRAYALSGYSSPKFNGYSAPVAAQGYSAPSAAPGYGTPSAAPGYSKPSL